MKIYIKNKRGFTLIELLVVVAIIGLLSSVILASLNSARSKARDAVRLSDIKQISNALELYYSNNGVYPSGQFLSIKNTSDPNSVWQCCGGSAFIAALAPYLPKLPIDPKNNDVTCYANGAHFYTYQSFNAGKNYGIYASLENPKAGAADPANYPCCATSAPGNCMYKATNGGVGIVPN